jgi:3-oxoacyl-[acyl-carrier-protein] synthase-3
MGFTTGKHKVTNQQIDQALDTQYLEGLNKHRIEQSENFQKAKEKYPNLTAFEYMAKGKMGFETRYHVVPFPPRAEQYKTAENSLDLLVSAIDKALNDAGVHPEDIAAWIVGTATPHEMAPGLAETAKSHFTTLDNRTETMTTTCACGAFNMNIERALHFFNAHPEAKHVVVAHTEVMSELLLVERDFVPFTTFGDGAAAVILSKTAGEEKEGVLDVVNFEDMAMIDFLGSDRNGHLIMEPRMVKARAVPNISRSIKLLMKKQNWTSGDVDLLVPHQTGHAIVHEVGENTGFTADKVFQEVQMEYGNLSGASVPASLCVLKESGRLKPGMHIVTGVAGLGGEYGGFAYKVPELENNSMRNNDLAGKTAVVTGCTGGLGETVANIMAEKGCRLILQYNSNETKAQEVLKGLANQQLGHKIIKANFGNPEEVSALIGEVKKETNQLSYLVHTVAATGSLNKASDVSHQEMENIHQVNYLSAKALTEGLQDILQETVLFTGSIAQDAQFSGSSAYVASKRALYGFAAGYSQLVYPNLRCIFYIPGVIDGGMTNVLNDAQIQASMMAVGQDKLIPLQDIALRVVKSLYIPKVTNVRSEYDGVLLVRKDGYQKY